MHLQLTDPQIIVGVFVLTLGLIFAIAALAQSRVKKAPPFQDYFYTEYDRSLFPDGSFQEPEDVFADQNQASTGLDPRYFDSSEFRAESEDTGWRNRE